MLECVFIFILDIQTELFCLNNDKSFPNSISPFP